MTQRFLAISFFVLLGLAWLTASILCTVMAFVQGDTWEDGAIFFGCWNFLALLCWATIVLCDGD